jgi:hypothetical protein
LKSACEPVGLRYISWFSPQDSLCQRSSTGRAADL